MTTRYLTFIRHAKSSWDHPGLSDHDRPLASKGLKDAPLIALHNRDLLHSVEHFFCSTAERAVQTFNGLKNGAALPDSMMSLLPELYTFNAREIADVVQGLPNEYLNLALIGHNPAFTEAINYFTDEDLLNMPTASIVQVQFKLSSWQNAARASGQLILFDSPKNYR